jgi:DNA-directed RNA polymerase specialized sigma subunit
LREQAADNTLDHQEEVMVLLNRLPERERRVLMITVLFRDPETGCTIQDEQVDAYAARRLGLTPEHVRQIRRRAIRELRAMFNPAV